MFLLGSMGFQTQPTGLVSPAILAAFLAGPPGKIS
jgi:hypothetical protein